MNPKISERPIALITGASRKIGIGAAIAEALAASGWDIATTHWRLYDEKMPWGSESTEAEAIVDRVRHLSAQAISIEADLSEPDSPTRIFDAVEESLGPVTALVMAHCESVASDILTTSVESFDLHFAVNARATWLLMREFGKRFQGGFGHGRIISITSDHTVGHIPYGASKGAMDRIVIAAAEEFKGLGVTANVINPGGTDTGWMTDDLKTRICNETHLGRVGLPLDCANLVRFLCAKEGGWINGQLLYSNGGLK